MGDAAYSDLILGTPGLVAYWRLGDRSGTIARDEAGRYAGTYNAAPVLGALGPIRNDLGRAATFATASSQYVSSPAMGDLPIGGARRTLECWINSPTLPDNRQGYFGYGDAGANQVVNMEYLPGNGLYIVGYAAGDLAPTPHVLINGTWRHIAVTYDGVTARSYVDGRQVGSGARSWNSVSAAKQLGIGRQSYSDPPFYYVGGAIAEAAIYSRALGPLELAEHNAAGRGALSIEILSARRYVTGAIEAVAHLDNSRFLDDGVTPDPVWVLRHSWFINPDDWASRTPAQRQAWQNAMQQEFAELCKSQLAIVSDREAGGTVLAIEGQTFPP